MIFFYELYDKYGDIYFETIFKRGITLSCKHWAKREGEWIIKENPLKNGMRNLEIPLGSTPIIKQRLNTDDETYDKWYKNVIKDSGEIQPNLDVYQRNDNRGLSKETIEYAVTKYNK